MPVHRIRALLAVLLVSVLVAAPTAHAAGPAITGIDVTPSLLFGEGGLVTISADVAGATTARAEVSGPAGPLTRP